MKRNLSTARPFRPRLESLEGRDLPSGTGVLLFFLSQGLQQQVQKVEADNNQLTADVNALAALPKQAVNTFSITQQNATKAVDADRAKLQSDFSTLKGMAQQDQLFMTLALLGGNLDQTDFFLALLSFNAANQAQNDVNNLPGQVAADGQKLTNLYTGFFVDQTVNQVQQAFGYSSPLALS
jgi:hypothetical protein